MSIFSVNVCTRLIQYAPSWQTTENGNSSIYSADDLNEVHFAGAGVTGDAYFGRFRKSWYIYRLQLPCVVHTHFKESLPTTLSMRLCRGWTTFLSILQAVPLRLPRPLLHDGTIIGLLHTLTTACASRSMMSAQRGHWQNH